VAAQLDGEKLGHGHHSGVTGGWPGDFAAKVIIRVGTLRFAHPTRAQQAAGAFVYASPLFPGQPQISTAASIQRDLNVAITGRSARPSQSN